MPNPQFVEFAGKKEYHCPKCKAPIRYAKYFGSDGKLLTNDGKEPFAGMVDGKYKSNTGWPTDPNTQKMHECKGQEVNKMENVDVVSLKPLMAPESEIIDKSQLDTTPQAKELNFDDLGMESLRKEILVECAILWKEEEWITNYLKIKLGGESPHPSRVGLWHKLISERLARSHESG